MKNLKMIAAYLFTLGMMLFIVSILSGCAPQKHTRPIYSPTECRQAGGVMVCDHWDCECIDREQARRIFMH